MSEELDPSVFVERIRQLGNQRDQQDAERVRKLEEEIQQGRSERLARRAERARTLSPDKPTTPTQTPTQTPQSLQSATDTDTPTPAMEPPSQQSARDDSLQRLTSPPAEAPEGDEPKKTAPSAAALGRSGTLSWQRRPQSSAGSARRPLSMAAGFADKSAASSPRDTPEPSSPERPISRSQIAQSLGAKDPSWFKQTSDRGAGSAALRRNQEDNASDAGSVAGRRQLPGLSRDSTAEPEAISPPPVTTRPTSSSQASQMKSPLPVLDSQKLPPPLDPEATSLDGGDQATSVRPLAMSPTQGRISPERPASPTKGMGGFVQSAMLKRSDSVSKRWSTQQPPVLSRQNSTLSNRGSTYGSLAKADARPNSLSRGNSIEPSLSRPGSSASNFTVTRDTLDKESTPREEFVKPALPRHNRSKSVASTFVEDSNALGEASPPSPSKRWSPTKSSWLENALKRPESPKITQPPPQQPSWMTELNRIKQQRGSVDLGKGGPLTSPSVEKSVSGRTSPIKDVQLKPVGLRKVDPVKKEEIEQPSKPSPKAKPAVSLENSSPALAETKEPERVEELQRMELITEPDAPKDSSNTSETAPEAKPAPSTSQSSKGSPLPPPTTKPKPETLPKKDFRAGLRSRQDTSEDPKNGEVSELQSVFGRLKKAETKNYVAPDPLKDNILRGKSALALTGGPKPSVRRNEFRESLVIQKSAMLAKAQETGSAAHKRADSSSQPPSTPEAIARRHTLGRSDSISNPPPSIDREVTPEAISRKKSLRASKPIISEKPPQITASVPPKEPVKTGKLADRFNPALAGVLARGPSPISSKSVSNGDASNSAPVQPVEETKKGPAPELTHMTKGRARGPKRRAPAAKQSDEKETKNEFSTPSKVAPVATVPLVKARDVLPSNVSSRTDKESEILTNMRTPARTSLKAKPTTPAKSPVLAKKMEKSPTPEPPPKPAALELGRRVSAEVKGPPEKTPEQKAGKSSPAPSPRVASWKSPETLPSPLSKTAQTTADAPRTRKVMPTPADESFKPSTPKTPSWNSSRPLPTLPPKPESQQEVNTALKEIPAPNVEKSPVRATHSPDKPGFSVKGATALWGQQSASSSPVPSRTKSPIKLPTRADERAAMKDSGLVRSVEPEPVEELKRLPPKPKPAGLGLGLGSFAGFGSRTRSRESSPTIPASTKSMPISPPVSGGRPQSVPFKASPAPTRGDDPFAEYFDEPPVTSDELPENINTIQILKSPPLDLGPGGKIRTLRKQIQEISGDGKLSHVPMQEEHVLYQDAMYLCTHVYGDANGARITEVYLWAGNGVSESTLEDAQLFGRNFAKQNQGKLVIFRQGNELPNFFEALGGIVITRRGARPAAKEYMLCGRRHLGHIAFDEVDFSLKSLSSGFPYLVATAGKVFLWKGRGCSAEELSAARLMGMDLTTTGELVEVEESSVSQAFMNIFPPADPTSKQPAIPQSAAFWGYKATSERYRTRLFKIEQQQGSSGWGQLQVSSFFAPLLRRPSWQSTERPQTPTTPKSPQQITTKVVEIMPYCQRDLEPEYIYVLDAFFEMYIIVGALSRSQSTAFSTALMFAQEYSMIAVSEEDRPFMPVTTVVFEGVPRDMKAVFRFWDDASIPAAALMRGKLGRGKSLRMMGLNKAIEATRR